MSAATPIGDAPNAWRAQLLYDEKRHPKRALANVITMLSLAPEWRGLLVFDEFAERISTARSPPWHDERREPGPWTEQDDVRLVQHVERELHFSLRPGEAHAAVDNVARRLTANPLVKWLRGLKWDMTQRLDTWLSTYAGVAPSDYASQVGRWFMIGAIARAMRPGCKVDHVLVLEGPQGKRKSTCLRVLAGEEWFADSPIDLASKDRFVALQGIWIQEIAELDGFDRGDVNRIKSYLSSPVDVYRPPYARASVKVPRRAVFAATVNGDSYLRDETGNRRFWPVRCDGTIDLVGLARDREQLWAEAMFKFGADATWWPDSAEAVAACVAEQGDRVQRDAWEPMIAGFIGSRSEITVADLLRRCLELEPAKWGPTEQQRIARVLRILGWERAQVRRDGVRVWLYRPGEGVTTCHQLEIGGGDTKT